MSEPQERRILALVLTHNAPQALARCLVAIRARMRYPRKSWSLTTRANPQFEDTAPKTWSVGPRHPVRSERWTCWRIGDRSAVLLGQRLHPCVVDG